MRHSIPVPRSQHRHPQTPAEWARRALLLAELDLSSRVAVPVLLRAALSLAREVVFEPLRALLLAEWISVFGRWLLLIAEVA